MASSTSIARCSSPLRIGMIGAGTVGGGVYDIIMNRLGGVNDSNGSNDSNGNGTKTGGKRSCKITKICVRNPQKPRSFQIYPQHTQIVTDISSIYSDPSIDLVVEVMGGTTVAKEAVLESLKRGKSVVTANKALIAEGLEELVEAVDGANTGDSVVNFGYEASVCGGIPVIHVLQSCYTGDVINEVMGICNGTTNFMLCKMEEGGDYAEVLKEAQDLGFAEADPTADVEGHDVRAKIAILAKLAYGTTIPVESIPCTGITKISVADFAVAKSMGCTIKLVGTAIRQSGCDGEDEKLSVYVSPKIVPNSHLLASANGCGNAVAIDSANLGIASYTGPGAGRYATANSIVSDIVRIANSTSYSSPFPLSSSDITIDNDYTSAFYIRVPIGESSKTIQRIGELSESQNISVHSILKPKMTNDKVVITDTCKYSQVKALCELIEKEEFAVGAPVLMPMIAESA